MAKDKYKKYLESWPREAQKKGQEQGRPEEEKGDAATSYIRKTWDPLKQSTMDTAGGGQKTAVEFPEANKAQSDFDSRQDWNQYLAQTRRAVLERGGTWTDPEENIRLQGRRLPTQEELQAEAERRQLFNQIAARDGGGVGGAPGQMQEDPGYFEDVNLRQTALATAGDAPGIVAKGIGAAGGGALVGAQIGALGGPIGAVGGGIAGGVGGLLWATWESASSNIASQKADNIQGHETTLEQNRESINRLISLIKADPQNAEKYVTAVNDAEANIANAYSKLKYRTDTNLNLALEEDGTRALMRYKNYYAEGGRNQAQKMQVQQALANPDLEQGVKELMMAQEMGGGE